MTNKIKLIFLNIICIFLLTYLAILSWQYIMIGTQYFKSDYKTFYKSLRENTPVYQEHNYVFIKMTTQKTFKQVSPVIAAININTPTMNLILKTIVNVSHHLKNNTKVWTYLSLLGAALSLFILMRWLSDSKEPFYFFYPLLLVFYCSWASLYNMALGQVTFLLVPLFCLAFYFDEEKHEAAMTITLALLSTLKVFFLIFTLLFILRRQWRLLFLFSITFLFFFFLPLTSFTWHDYGQFFSLVHNHLIFMTRATLPMNGSFLGIVTKVCVLFKLHANDMQIQIALALLSLFVITRWLIYDYRFLRKLPDFVNGLRYSFLIVIALLCSPLGWLYYDLFFIVPIFVFYKISLRYQLSKTFYVYLSLAFILPYFGWLHSTHGIFASLQLYPVFFSLLCWLACVYYAARAVFDNKPSIASQSKIMIGILVATSFLNIVLLSFNYGIEHFLDGRQQYFNQLMPTGVWVNSKN